MKKCVLGDICTKIGSGATPTGGRAAYAEEGVSLIRSQNVLDLTLLGATVAHLGKTHLDDIDIIVPPKDMRAFQMLNDLDASIVQQGLEAAKLSALRDFLLPVLMNGQVKVG